MIEEITVFQWVKRVYPAKLGRFRKGKMVAAKKVDKDEADAVVNHDGAALYLKKVTRDHMVKFDKEIPETDRDDFFYEPNVSADRVFLIEKVAWEKMVNKNVFTATMKRERGDADE